NRAGLNIVKNTIRQIVRGPARLRRSRFLLLGGLIVVLAAAVFLFRNHVRSPAHHALYFWQTEWSASPALRDSLTESGIDKLYMRFFDVEWNAGSHTTNPVSPLRLRSELPKNVEIIPVVYLVNEVFLRIDDDDVPLLAKHVWEYVQSMSKENGVAFRELQMDCDWTDTTKRSYFRFINILNESLKQEKKTLSATIRLHQVKYFDRTGVPPVDRGMLMFYNFGKIQTKEPGASIFSGSEAAKYSSYISGYPLKLDVVLPMFSWTVHARDNTVMGLMENVGSDDADHFDGFRLVSENRYVATRSFFFRGRYFMDGDILLIEETTPEITRQAAALARQGAGWHQRYETVALFDLNEQRLKRYSASQMRSILAQF
ncbi:MAG TPA: hypothetical protein VFO86_16445, partial [Terriglobia bacterium]|nr:hypothetical protein [Terriglobia bacterium]